MEKYISDLPHHLKHAVEIASEIKIGNISKNTIKNILICGLGGSGIGGSITKNYVFDKCHLPVEVVKSYDLPKYVGEDSLVILNSYSGNTEETISCLEQALKLTKNIVLISSGGRLKEYSEVHGLTLFQVPSGFQPRAAIGYSLVMILNVFVKLELIENDVNAEILETSNYLLDLKDEIHRIANDVAQNSYEKNIILYTETCMEGIAVRWRQQINENSKKLCFHHVIPEMNHNELVAFQDLKSDDFIIFLRHKGENDRNSLRFDFCVNKIQDNKIESTTIFAQSDNYWNKVFYLIWIGDWVSFYISELKKIDSIEVKIIEELKSFLQNN